MIEAARNYEKKGRGDEKSGIDFLVKRDTILDRCWESHSTPASSHLLLTLLTVYK